MPFHVGKRPLCSLVRAELYGSFGHNFDHVETVTCIWPLVHIGPAALVVRYEPTSKEASQATGPK